MPTDPTWWITVVEAPIVAALFWMIHGLRRDLQERIERSDQRKTDSDGKARDELAAFKLEVARTYVPLSLMRDLDRRISEQLLRIEAKLEAAMDAARRPPPPPFGAAPRAGYPLRQGGTLEDSGP